MTALLDLKGDFAHSIPVLCTLLGVKGKLLPLTEDNVDLIGITKDGKEIVGEEQITESKSKIIDLKYNKDVEVTPKVLEEIKKADLILFSSGSLLTSIMPHLIVPEIQDAIRNSKAKKMYISNMLTQPGETDDFTVSDHIKVLEKYLGKNTIDAVIVNTGKLAQSEKIFAKSEGKKVVELDMDTLQKKGITVIADNIAKVEDGYIRHDALKTGYLIFSYLMDGE